VLSELGKKYDVKCSYDGEYLRAYVSDPELNLEPWSAFEIKVGELGGSIYVCEATGYGASISTPEIKALDTLAQGVTYQNNVINNAADPDIIYHDGYYYMYVTGDHYPVYRSADLAKWEYVGVSLPEVSWNIDKRYMWAPDVEYINGKFYMAVSMGEAGFGIAVAERPEGPFVCAGDMPFLTKTIDGHIFVDDDGRIYLYYTSWCDGRAYGIWGVEMESDCLTPKWETEKLIFTPTEDWEMTMNMGKIVEAPFMLKKEGVYYLVYSGSNYQADYAVGYATSDKPLEGFVKSANNPILRGTADTRGTGHCSIIETPAGGMVMVYHVHNTTTAVQPRHVAIDPVRFVKTADGYRLEVCGPTTSKVPIDIFK
jgi:beta-xylosidase